jgi:general secretion pathway protein B
MSFILDALKKSEIERQRQSMPGLMDAPTSLRRGRLPLWAILLGCLLAINVVILSIVLMRNGRPSAAASTSVKHDTSSADAKVPQVDEHFSPLARAPVYAPEIPVPPAETSSSNKSAEASAAPHAIAQRAAPHTFRRPDPILTDEEADNDEVLPTINEINLTGAQALAELHLDVHVYATRPADRFVFINMRKYKEGNTLQEGPVLEKIRRDGVVLNYQGLRFVLPRQS